MREERARNGRIVQIKHEFKTTDSAVWTWCQSLTKRGTASNNMHGSDILPWLLYHHHQIPVVDDLEEYSTQYKLRTTSRSQYCKTVHDTLEEGRTPVSSLTSLIAPAKMSSPCKDSTAFQHFYGKKCPQESLVYEEKTDVYHVQSLANVNTSSS